jgi:hypothetical protein
MATKTKTKPVAILVATETFSCDIDGAPFVVKRDVTRVRADNELYERYPQCFKPVDESYEVEQATAAPGERRAR